MSKFHGKNFSDKISFYFLQVSESCHDYNVPPTKHDWPTESDAEEVVKFCPNRLSKLQEVKLGQYNMSMVPYLPKELLDIITWLSPDPMAWFIGQFVKYILRPKPWLQKELNELKRFHPGDAFKQCWQNSKIISLGNTEL